MCKVNTWAVVLTICPEQMYTIRHCDCPSARCQVSRPVQHQALWLSLSEVSGEQACTTSGTVTVPQRGVRWAGLYNIRHCDCPSARCQVSRPVQHQALWLSLSEVSGEQACTTSGTVTVPQRGVRWAGLYNIRHCDCPSARCQVSRPVQHQALWLSLSEVSSEQACTTGSSHLWAENWKALTDFCVINMLFRVIYVYSYMLS